MNTLSFTEISRGWNINSTNTEHVFKEINHHSVNFHQEQLATDVENLEDRLCSI